VTLRLSSDGKQLASALVGNVYPGVPVKDQELDLGKGFPGKAWTLAAGNGFWSLGAVPVALDDNTDGVAIHQSFEGADYIHHTYEIWKVAASPKPSLKRVYSAGATNGPFTTELRLHPPTAGSPFRVAALTYSFLSEVFGEGEPNTFVFEVQAWNEASGKFKPVRIGRRSPVPLYALLAGSHPSFAEANDALKKLAEKKCSAQTGPLAVYASDSAPLFTPKLYVIASFFLDEGEAKAALARGKACHPDGQAYVKRAF
jgi:hypothetical protein